MKRHLSRILLALAAGILLMPLDASAQTSAKVYRIGVLDMTPPDLRSPNQMAFYEELRQRGYVEGQNLVVERRNAAGQPDQLPALARELVALRPDLIVASAPQPNRAVKDATSTIPIVMIAVADPVRAGLVASLARPGGNLTGVATVVPGGIHGEDAGAVASGRAEGDSHRDAGQSDQRDASNPCPAGDSGGGAATGRPDTYSSRRARQTRSSPRSTLRSANELRLCSSMVIRCSTTRLSGFRNSWRARASRRSTFCARKWRPVD